MCAEQSNRQAALVEKLLQEYRPQEHGTAVDTDRIRALIAPDPDLAAQVFPVLLRWNAEHSAGMWGLLLVIATVYEKEYRDDSLTVLLTSAARAANVTMPKMLSFTPHPTTAPGKIVELQMAAEDVKAGDAHRVLMTMRLERMPTEMREQIIGKCIISFPASGDPRPIQRIPEVRRFVADLHKRMRHFPLFLNFDPKHLMHLVYFGCLADEQATRVQGTDVALDMLDQSFVQRMGESLTAIRDVCRPLKLDWHPSVRQILAVYDRPTRRSLFGRDWDI